MGITTPDNILYPDAGTALPPLETHFASLAESVQQALNALRGATAPPVASASARNTLYPTPTQGNTVYRMDLGYTERYYAEYSVGGNPGGATPAGWYPESGTVPSGVMKRTTTACAFGNATYAIMSENTKWTSTASGGHLGGGMQYSNGFIVPVTGIYRIGLSVFTTSGGGAQYSVGIGLNAATSPGGDNLLAFQATPTGVPAMGASSMEEIRLSAGDKLNIWGFAAGTQGITPSPSIGPSFSCVYVGPPQG